MLATHGLNDFWRVALSAPPRYADWVSDVACDRVKLPNKYFETFVFFGGWLEMKNCDENK